MILLQGVVLLALALVLQAALGRLWPGVHLWVDCFLVPVVCFGTAGRQRAAMLTGCAGGLLGDTWFRVGTFGLGGFKLTLLGWLLALVAGRLDLSHTAGRFFSGVAVSVAADALELILHWMLDQRLQLPGLLALCGKALVTGLLATAVGGMLDRVGDARRVKRFV